MEVFKADDNLITTIDIDAFQVAKNLTIITLSHNKIKFSASEKLSAFENCKNLEKLDLSYNEIEIFYDDWMLLSSHKLQRLNLRNNKITLFYVSNYILFLDNLTEFG